MAKPKGSDQTAASLIPSEKTLETLKEAAAACKACPLWERATQTVFGEGLTTARVMLVGEQPGDSEDKQGQPFVGPAGHLLDKALESAGIHRNDTYITNIVKHFKWVQKGRLRLHQKPNQREIKACLPWLDAEIDLVRPQVLVVMGSTAAQGLLGKEVLVTKDRGKFLPSRFAPFTTVTVHPSSILRARTDEERHQTMADFVKDLIKAARILKKSEDSRQ